MNRQDNVNRPSADQHEQQLAAPPRFLLWLVIGIFLLAVIGGITGVVVFRNVLRPGQQQRIIQVLPFMNALVARQDPNATVPTIVAPGNSSITADDLLNSPLVVATEEATDDAAVLPTATTITATAVSVLPTQTPPPTQTATPLPTLEPTALPTTAPTADAASLTMASLGGVSVAQADAAEPLMSAAPASASLPTEARLFGFTHVQQTWNNCGPANITMALSFYSWAEDQSFAASFLKPDREDKNVSPSEMVAFVNENTGVRAATRIGGDMELLKTFLANDFPVIIETGYAPEGYDWIGHYRTVVGYDDNQQIFYIYDSYLGTGENDAGLTVSYDEFDRDWQAFNRVFLVIYLQEREGDVINILGERADPMGAAEHALEVAQEEARANRQNQYAWFNMGTALTRLGRYEEAAAAYDRATQLGLHFRMLWYQFGPFEAYFNVGRYDDVLAQVTASLNGGGEYVEETYYWQGRVYAAQGRTNLASDSFRQALTHNPRFTAAQTALNELNA